MSIGIEPPPPIPVVIATIPAELGPVDVAVHHREWGVEVDVRPAGTSLSWTPLALMGGNFTTRPA